MPIPELGWWLGTVSRATAFALAAILTLAAIVTSLAAALALAAVLALTSVFIFISRHHGGSKRRLPECAHRRIRAGCRMQLTGGAAEQPCYSRA